MSQLFKVTRLALSSILVVLVLSSCIPQGVGDGVYQLGAGIKEIADELNFNVDKVVETVMKTLGVTKDVAEQTLGAVDKAITTLDQNSQEWQDTLKQLETSLTEDLRSTIRNEVTNLAITAIGVAGTELRCNIEFGIGVKDRLRQIVASWLGKKLLLKPEFCQTAPPLIAYGEVQAGHLPALIILGYNFDIDTMADLHVFLVDAQQEQDVTGAVQKPTNFMITVNLGQNGVPLTTVSDKLIVRWQGKTIYDITVSQPPTPTPTHTPTPIPPTITPTPTIKPLEYFIDYSDQTAVTGWWGDIQDGFKGSRRYSLACPDGTMGVGLDIRADSGAPLQGHRLLGLSIICQTPNSANASPVGDVAKSAYLGRTSGAEWVSQCNSDIPWLLGITYRKPENVSVSLIEGVGLTCYKYNSSPHVSQQSAYYGGTNGVLQPLTCPPGYVVTSISGGHYGDQFWSVKVTCTRLSVR